MHFSVKEDSRKPSSLSDSLDVSDDETESDDDNDLDESWVVNFIGDACRVIGRTPRIFASLSSTPQLHLMEPKRCWYCPVVVGEVCTSPVSFLELDDRSDGRFDGETGSVS